MSGPDVLLQVDDVVKHFPLRQGSIVRREVGAGCTPSTG